MTSDKTVDAGSDLNFGAATNFEIASGVRVRVGAGVGVRTMAIRAGSITLRATAQILGDPTNGQGDGNNASVELQSLTGNVTLESNGTNRSRVDVGGDNDIAGAITIISAANANINGQLDAASNGEDSEGGAISVTAVGTVTVGQEINASASGSGAGGGSVFIEGGGNVALNAKIDTTGADFGGGDVEARSTGGNLTITNVDMSGGNPDGEPGEGSFAAPNGDITVGTVVGKGGSGSDGDCGDGAIVSFTAGGTTTFNGMIDLKGGSTCGGGEIELSTGLDFIQNASSEISAVGPGEGFGGQLFFTVGRHATFRKVDISSGGNGFGGTLEADSTTSLQVLDTIKANATGSFGVGGFVRLGSCTLNVASTGTIDTRGPFVFFESGINRLQAGGPMTVAGTLRAGNVNELQFRTVAPVVTGTVDPAPVTFQEPTLPECADIEACGDGDTEGDEVCDDGNTLSCDGCSANCSRVDNDCGDGTRECDEQCDDGNDVAGDGCEPDCTPTGQTTVGLRIRGGGANGCQGEWVIDTTEPELNPKTGEPRSEQECVDGDPGCDADELNNGQCTIATEICLRVNDENLPECSPAPIQHVDMLAPIPGKGKNQVTLANADAFLNALKALGVTVRAAKQVIHQGAPLNGFNVCTQSFPILVPLNGAKGKASLKFGTQDTSGDRMKKNKLQLRCLRNDAVCGNDVTEIGESCDDGNQDSCDGCSPLCRVEACGNGSLECGEQCDDGDDNGTPESRCSNECKILPPSDLRISGGGSRAKDCVFAWSMEIDPAKLIKDKNGNEKNRQECVDNDPACDFDNTVGNCRMRIWGCAGGNDAAASCTGGSVTLLEAVSPKSTSKRPFEVAARQLLDSAIASISLPTGPGEECSNGFDVDVPAKNKLRLKVKALAEGGSATKDVDSLQLLCK